MSASSPLIILRTYNITNKHFLSTYLQQNDSSKQATFENFGGNFLIFQQL